MDVITLRLTDIQASEVQCGLDTDAADYPGEPLWGQIEPVGNRQLGGQLIISGTQLARDRALYRITSSRDICLDNAAERLATANERARARARGRSLDGLTRRLIEAAGDIEAFSPDVRRWARY